MSIKLIVVLAHSAFLLVYALLVGMLLWHYRKYSLPRDKARWIIGLFIFFASLFAVVATIILFFIPWEDMASSLPI